MKSYDTEGFSKFSFTWLTLCTMTLEGRAMYAYPEKVEGPDLKNYLKAAWQLCKKNFCFS